jgi:nitroreductase
MRAETSVPINEVIATRRSLRSFDASHELAKTDLLAGLEAARWAPSAFNGQPWRFYAGLRGDEVFAEIFSSLVEFNQMWTKNASALILVASAIKKNDGSDHLDYQFDCGLAVGQMVHEFHDRGLIAHQMTGYSKDLARTALDISVELVPVVVIAVGKQDVAEKLPESIAARENAPRERLPLAEIVIKGLPQ